MAQQARIYIEVEDTAETAAAEAESVPEPTDLGPESNATVMELSEDDEDTDEQMDNTVPEHGEDADIEAA